MSTQRAMAQFRYYGQNNIKNYPRRFQNVNLCEGFKNITQLGIQAPPDTVFYINGSPYGIYMGNTGIYEIDLYDYGFIQSVVFKNIPDDLEGDRILVDIIYETKEGDEV